MERQSPSLPNSSDKFPVSSSVLFRMFSFHEDDYGKPHIRIEKQYMEKLGIEPGDVVKVIGNREVPAIVLPLESSYRKPYDPVMECLDEKSKEIPQARVSDVISKNAKNGNIGGSLVYVSKLDPPAASADKIFLGRLKEQFQYDESQLDLDSLRQGYVIGKGDRISVDKKSNTLDKVPFVIIDGNPNGKFWTINKNTEFEFVDVDPNTFYSIIDQQNPVKTVQSGKTIHDEKFEMTLDKIEVFENLSIMWFTTREEYPSPEKVPFAMFAEPAFVSITDDLGNSYHIHSKQEVGGSGSEEEGMIKSMWYAITPSINPNANKISMTIAEMTWFGPLFENDIITDNSQENQKKNHVTSFVYDRPTAKTIIKSGPWEFEISLS